MRPAWNRHATAVQPSHRCVELVGMSSGFGIFTVLQFWLEALLAPGGDGAPLLDSQAPAAAAAVASRSPGAAMSGELPPLPLPNATALAALAAARAQAPSTLVAAVSIGCTSVLMVARPLSGVVYDRVGAGRFLPGLQGAQLATHALLAAQQATGVGDPWAPPLLVFAIFGCFAAAVTSWAPLTLDLLRKPEVLPTMLLALPAAQALSAALMGLLVDLHSRGSDSSRASHGAALDALRSFATIMTGAHALALALGLRLLRLCRRAAPLSAADGGAAAKASVGTSSSRSELPREDEAATRALGGGTELGPPHAGAGEARGGSTAPHSRSGQHADPASSSTAAPAASV